MLRSLRRLSSAVRMVSTPTLKLSSGYDMPLVGFGIWKVPKESCAQAVYDAIKLGYRHIDGAYDYQNSAEAGQGVQKAIKDGLVKREELFITSKLWCNYKKREHALEFAKYEVDTWGIDYIDLYLIHFPISLKFIPPSELKYPVFWSDAAQKTTTARELVPVSETWAALESLVQTKDNPSGIFRSIGVANFSSQLLQDLFAHAKIRPAALQIEHHPYLVQQGLVDFAQRNDVAVTAYSSFGPASFVELDNPRLKDCESLFTNPVITKIAEKHGRTPAQVLLRWATQRKVLVIPKSNNNDRLKQNLDSTSFELSEDDIKQISGLNQGVRFNNPADFGLQCFD